MDSGCSYHMCPREDWFMDYQEVDGGKVLMGNNVACKVMGIGSISMRMFDGVTRILKNVGHVPELKRNLISLDTLDESGYGFKAENGQLKVSKGAMVVMKGFKKNGLYILQGSTVKAAACNAESPSSRKKPSYGIKGWITCLIGD
ncbi:hypothetical protein PanWU01x14_167780 [Parasponia andersonii]|uniref:Retrovirus-related Pol polyprotein from transposon TNT 1-94-like beta-barrel domain-containing protein n=1 Tax=Parasponia andersonii TaxID=3476 RepID=A0A2P5CAU7_PARAD|nr:hypothetical protein PanWU01x14_167780 [Parasponia andersonii]